MEGDPNLTEDEKIKIGQQQAAMIQMQEQRNMERQQEHDLMEAQQKALHFKMEQDRHKMAEQQSMMLQEKQKEDELARLQQIALMERQQEQQKMQIPSSAPGGPPMPPIPPAVPQPLGGFQQPPMAPQPQQMNAPPHQHMSAPPQQMTGPPQPPMTGPPQPPMAGPPQQMGAPPQQLGAPPQPPMTGPPQQLGAPPQQMSAPPQQMGQPQMRGPPDQRGPPAQQMMGGPPTRDGIPSLMSASVTPVSQSGHQMPPQQRFGGPQGPPSRQDGIKNEVPQQQFGRGPERKPDGPPSLLTMETRPPPVKPVKEEGDDDEEGEAIEGEGGEFKLPPALEKVLAFKDARVQEVGVKPEEMERIEQGELVEDEASREEQERIEAEQRQAMQQQQQQLLEEAEDEDEEEEAEPKKESSNKKESKNKKRKKKKKRAKQRQAQNVPTPLPVTTTTPDVEIEYVQEELHIDRSDPNYREFSKIFEAFKIAEPEKPKEEEVKKEAPKEEPKEKPPKAFGQESSDEDSDSEMKKPEPDEDKTKLSKKKQKKLNRLSVAELKQLVIRPDVVEMHDVTARDPKLLVHLKATKNTVPVPRHWCFKRKYLQGKRGIEKLPFDLPDFIKNTGIMEMRQALQDKEEAKNLKAKMREKVRPKMGKIDIDYQKLHDAFFKYQTKPKMTGHGDLYYEGKEFETKLKEKKPGDLTDDMRTALGMPLGPNADKYPPPWLIAMQRYGPPPSYPNLKIAGLNAPIPENCSFGYHAGGWGKPPVDETGKPLYGDVFGQNMNDAPAIPKEEEDANKTLWGELESESEEEESEEEESEEEEEGADASGLVTPGDPGLVTPSGTASVPVGTETPDMIELRKKRIEDAMDQGGDTPALYQVLKEKTAAVGGSMMGSAHVYELGAGAGTVTPGKNAEGVEVALNPDELDLDTAAIQAKYDQQMREQQSQLEKEEIFEQKL